jgi:hypothetical protein
MVTLVIVVLDEARDLGFEITGQIIVLELSEKVAERPIARKDATEFVGDIYKIPSNGASSLVDLCKKE